MSEPLIAGVHTIAPTPFLPDESLDPGSMPTLIDYLVREGADGILVLGVLGEADRLSDAERDQVLGATLDAAAGKLQVSVGITHQSTAVTIARAKAAEAAGVAAVMVSPPIGSSAGPALRRHFTRIAEAISIPFIVQDHPTSSGVQMPVDFIAGLAEVMPPNSAVKVEAPPTAPKMAILRETAPGYQLFGGLGGVSLLYELDAGAAGTMTGFGLPSILKHIIVAHQAGDRATARAAFERFLPLLAFEAQPGAGVSLRKEILRQRGALAHNTVRQPAPTADPSMLKVLDELLAELPVRAGA